MSSFAAGAAGVQLRYRSRGPIEQPADAPVLVLIHGWSQSLEAWDPLFESELAKRFRLVAYDLRGHGESDAPAGPRHYNDGRLWADDLAAVIDEACGPTAPVLLVGWSYGGFIISDYLRHHGSDRVRGICFVAASVNLDDQQVPDYLAPMFPPLAERTASQDPREAEAAIREFVALCSAEPLDREVFESVVATNLLTTPAVRAALGDRLVNSDDVLGDLARPVLILQGTVDRVVLPATAQYIESRCRDARIIYYDGVGHLPMLEASERLATDLCDFAARVTADS